MGSGSTAFRSARPLALAARAGVALVLALALAPEGSSQVVRVNGTLAHGPGEAGEDVLAFQFSPDGGWVVFFSDTDLEDHRYELFSAPADARGSVRKLNAPLVAGGNLVRVFLNPFFAETPHVEIGAQRVVYVGDQDVDEVQELFSAPIDGSAPPVKLSGAMVAGGDVHSRFALSPDGQRVLFLADRESDDVFELWSVPIDASAAPVRLNAAPLAGSGFQTFGDLPALVSPDGLTVVFRLDQAAPGVFELWSVPIDGSTSPVRLNGTLVPGGDVSEFRISPDGSQVLYLADQALNDKRELWRAPLDGSALPVRVNAALIAAGDVDSFSISPDGTRAAYLADQELDGLPRLYSARIVGAAQVTGLSQPASTTLGVFDARISPDSQRVVYWGDAEVNEVYEVFSVPIDGSAAPVRLNDALVPNGDVGDQTIGTAFRISPDGQRVVYWADAASVDRMELFSVPIDRSSSPVRISGQLVAGGAVQPHFAFSADGSRVVYRADAHTDQVFELWSSPIDGSGPPLRLNGVLTEGGDVQAEPNSGIHTGYAPSPDGALVVYRADQSSNDLFSLWSVPIDRSRPPREFGIELDAGPVLGDVQDFGWTPDGTRLLYAADEHQDEVVTLQAAEIPPAAPFEPPARVLLGQGGVFELGPDSAWVAFRSLPTCDSPPFCTPSAPLAGVPLDGSLPAAPWSQFLPGYAARFRFDPSGAYVVYRQISDPFRSHYEGLFSIPVDGSSGPISLTEPAGMILDSLHLGSFASSPDGARVVYRMNSFGETALWSVPHDRSLPPVVLSGPVTFPRELHDTFVLTEDGQAVIFVADLTKVGVFELYRAPLDGSAPPARLGSPLPSHADVDPAFRLRGQHVFFAADIDIDGAYQLWRTPSDPARGGQQVRLSPKPMTGGGGVLRGIFGDDGLEPQFEVDLAAERVVYLSDELVAGQVELFSVPLDGGASVRLNAALGAGEDVPAFGFRIDAPGARVAFAAPDALGILRLHAAPLDGSAPAIPLGGPFVAGGQLWTSPATGVRLAFELTPDGTTAVYVADALADEVFELFAAPLDGSAPARRLNRRLVAGGDVGVPPGSTSRRPFAIRPSGGLVAYAADQHTDEVVELFVAPLEPGPPHFARPSPAGPPPPVPAAGVSLQGRSGPRLRPRE